MQTKQKIIGGTAALATAGALIIGGLMLTNDDALAPKTETTAEAEWTPTGKPKAPVKIPAVVQKEWEGPTAKSKTKSGVDGFVKSVTEGTKSKKQANIALPSKEYGFTDDPSKAQNKDGSLNMQYSYWLGDTFTTESALLTEAVLNPTYGGWGRFQAPGAAKDIDKAMLGTVFSSEFYKGSKGKPYPLMADWAGDSYGGANIVESQGGFWWGKAVGNPKSVWKYDTDILGYRVTNTYRVEFTGNTADGETVTRKGTLVLEFTPTEPSVTDPDAFKVQISGGSLKLSGK